MNLRPNLAVLRAAAIVIILLAFVVTVWPTVWRYDRVEFGPSRQYIVRINRLTGHADALIPSQGWAPWAR